MPTDKARGKLFAKLIRQVEVAAREGGGDLDDEPHAAHDVPEGARRSVPIDTIERAIKRGTGELEGVTYEPITYEGYAPGGVAVLVEVLTDNRNRTGAEVRNIFTQATAARWPSPARWRGSSSARASSSSPRAVDEDDLMLAALDAGAEDIVDDGDTWQVTTRADRPARGARPRSRRPASTVDVGRPHDGARPRSSRSTTPRTAKKVLRVIDALEEHDDVQDVYANFDIPDAILETVEA